MIRLCTSHSITSYFRNPCSRLLYHMKKHHLCGGIPWVIMATTYAPVKTRQDWHAESLKSEEERKTKGEQGKNRAKPIFMDWFEVKFTGKPPYLSYFNHVQTMVSCRFSNPVTMVLRETRAEGLLLGSCCWKPSLMGSWAAAPDGIHWRWMAKGFHRISSSFIRLKPSRMMVGRLLKPSRMIKHDAWSTAGYSVIRLCIPAGNYLA